MINLPSGKTYLDPVFLLEKLGVLSGMKVADFGCGAGYFTLQAAEMVGNAGRVYALDIFKPNLSAVWSKVKTRGYDNVVRCVWTDLEIYGGARKIKDGSVDRGILTNVLHQSKKQKDILRECARLLKDEGKLLVVDWSKTAAFGPKENQLVSQERVRTMAAEVGLAEMERFKAGSYHWGMIFVKTH